MGKSVFNAISNIEIINNQLCLNNMTNLRNLDSQLLKIDSTYNKNILGGNTITASSFCFADVGANLLEMELYEYFSYIYNKNNKNNKNKKIK